MRGSSAILLISAVNHTDSIPVYNMTGVKM